MIRAVFVFVLFASAARADEERYAAALAPVGAGVVEASLGAGTAYAPGEVVTGIPVAPGIIVGARYGISDNVQIAFPLLLTLSSTLHTASAGDARFSITTGLAGLGADDSGVLTVPAVAASCALIGKHLALVITLDTSAVTNQALHVEEGGFGLITGVLWRVDDRVALGFSGHASSTIAPSTHGSRSIIGIGSEGGSVPGDVPTVRVFVADPLTLELWAFADFFRAGQSTGLDEVGANVSATWHFAF
ncbi:MAG TPA: hypothetical protein VGO62_15710 [Myxococcota bacterium]